MATDKGRPQIEFLGKSGVSYFEQLMMKRHRYDPMFLSRPTHVHSTPRDIAEISSVNINNRDLPFDEGAPSMYNIFYDPELAEWRSPHCETEECIATTSPSVSGSSGVEIVELNTGQSITSARLADVKIQPVELEQISAKPVAKSGKLNESTYTRPKSTNKQRIQSSRSKSKTRNSSSLHRSPSKVTSEVTESDIRASVKKAWSNCSHLEQTQLAQFFLHGVEAANDDEVDGEAKSYSTETDYRAATLNMHCKSKLASTIWLPGNSLCSMTTNQDSEINPATDLPPVTSRPRSQNQSPPMATLISKDHPTESDDENLTELELSVNNIEEREMWAEQRERDEEDGEALESLAWELASTVECEGRLTRCQSEMDKLDREIESVHSPGTPQQEQEFEEEAFVLSDLSKVMSEFEVYQRNVMEQDSD